MHAAALAVSVDEVLLLAERETQILCVHASMFSYMLCCLRLSCMSSYSSPDLYLLGRFDEWIQTTEKFVNKVFSGAEKQLKTESNAKEEKPEGTAPKAASSAGPPDRRQTKRKAKASGDEKDKSHASKRQSNKKA